MALDIHVEGYGNIGGGSCQPGWVLLLFEIIPICIFFFKLGSKFESFPYVYSSEKNVDICGIILRKQGSWREHQIFFFINLS